LFDEHSRDRTDETVAPILSVNGTHENVTPFYLIHKNIHLLCQIYCYAMKMAVVFIYGKGDIDAQNMVRKIHGWPPIDPLDPIRPHVCSVAEFSERPAGILQRILGKSAKSLSCLTIVVKPVSAEHENFGQDILPECKKWGFAKSDISVVVHGSQNPVFGICDYFKCLEFSNRVLVCDTGKESHLDLSQRIYEFLA